MPRDVMLKKKDYWVRTDGRYPTFTAEEAAVDSLCPDFPSDDPLCALREAVELQRRAIAKLVSKLHRSGILGDRTLLELLPNYEIIEEETDT